MRADVHAAWATMASKSGSRKSIRRLHDHLLPTEHVRCMACGFFGDPLDRGLVVITDVRVLLVRPVLFGADTRDLPLDTITSVQWQAGWAPSRLTFFTAAGEVEIASIDADDGKAVADKVRASITTDRRA